jgi:protocatechuate 3,4-dioxygenase beta subunit
MVHTIFSRRRFMGSCAALGLFPFAQTVASPACVPAVTNILGPAYRRGAPMRSRLCPPEEAGTPLAMSGRVVDALSCKPLPGTLIDVWQVDANGNYDMDSAAYRLRGKFQSAKDGRYAFETIEPVPYGRRPRHIHYLVTREGYEPRITQCYFAGDERNASDPYVKKELVIATTKRAAAPGRHAALAGVFDVALERERPVSTQDLRIYRDYIGAYEVAPGVIVTIGVVKRRLHWHLTKGEEPGDPLEGELLERSRTRFFLPEYDQQVTFVRDEHGKVTHTLNDHGDLARKIR